MRRLLFPSIMVGAAGCLNEPALVAITPEHAYVDGCVDSVISGHDLGTRATARLIGEPGTVELELAPPPNDPKAPEWAQDAGFEFHTLIQPAEGFAAHQTTAAGDPVPNGFYDVELTLPGEEPMTLEDGFYYVSCPAAVWYDHVTIPYLSEDPTVDTTVEVGGIIEIDGCSLTEDVQVEFLDAVTGTVAGSAGVVSDCLTSAVHAVVPALPDGVYTLQVVHTPTASVLPVIAQYCFDYYYYTCLDQITIGGAR